MSWYHWRAIASASVFVAAVGGCSAGSPKATESGDTRETVSATAATATTTTSTTVAPTTTIAAKQVLRGAMTLTDSDVQGTWSDCTGSGGYDDFGAGMRVRVTDGDGSIVGTGSTRGLNVLDGKDPQFGPTVAAARGEYSEVICSVVFEVEVKDAEFYTVEVGSRGELSYSRDELDSADWFIELSLG